MRTSAKSTGPAATLPGADPAAPARDAFAEVLAVSAVAVLVALHWLRALSVDGAAPVAADATTITLTAPLAFAAAGAHAAAGSPAAGASGGWHDGSGRRRLLGQARRLIVVAVPFAAVALPVVDGAGRLLWAPAALLLTAAMAPALRQLHRRWRGLEIVGLAAVAVAVDVVRFGTVARFGETAGQLGETAGRFADTLGGIGVLAGWVVAHQAGMLAGSGGLDRLRTRAALGLAVAGGAAVAVTLAVGALAASDRAVSPVPSAGLLLAATAGLVGLALAARPLIRRWAAPFTVRRGLTWLSRRLPAVYLWHLPAAVAVAGVSTRLGYRPPPPFSAAWYDDAPWRLLAAGVVLAALVHVTGRIERLAVGTTPLPSHQVTGSSTLTATGKVEA
ncbi:hypothetical protein [Jiangella gansuensis]|uniref:hypothetical protein n=1 Tax=Jiangella gansuensis TaxID=281473 RepID=UPI00047DFA9E|nr:hypothetical protein [Jiangella gansuensis]